MTNMFLFFGLFFPRLTLLVCWMNGSMPDNSTPFALDVAAAIIAPRLLIAWWGWEAGIHPLWIVMFVLGWLLSGSAFKSAKDRHSES